MRQKQLPHRCETHIMTKSKKDLLSQLLSLQTQHSNTCFFCFFLHWEWIQLVDPECHDLITKLPKWQSNFFFFFLQKNDYYTSQPTSNSRPEHEPRGYRREKTNKKFVHHKYLTHTQKNDNKKKQHAITQGIKIPHHMGDNTFTSCQADMSKLMLF